MTSEYERRYLAELYAEDDRLRAEHTEWLARREAQASPPVENSDRDDILYRRNENNEQVAPAADDGTGPPADDGDDEFAAAVEKFSEVVERRLLDLDRENALMRNEAVEVKALLGSALEKVARLEGQIDTLLAIIGQRAAARSAPEELPNWRRN